MPPEHSRLGIKRTATILSRKTWLFVLILLYSCEKTPGLVESTIAYGQILNSKTHAPMPGVSVLKIGHCPDQLISDTTYIGMTDANGKYEVKVDMFHANVDPIEACYDYLIAHYPNFEDVDLQTKRGAINECNISMEPNAFLKIHFKNVTPCTGSDYISFTSGPKSWTFYGAADTTIKIKMLPNYTSFISWQIFKCTTTYQNESIYFTCGDTVYRSILY